MTPDLELIDAAKHGDLDGALDAFQRGAAVDFVTDGWTPLFWAAQEGHTEIAGFLLDAGADVNFADSGGFTPLKQAVGEAHLDTVELLLLRCADVHHRCLSDGGCTVLHTAAAYGLLDCIRLLLLYGADPKMINDNGQTPHDTAIECGELEAASLLQFNGVA